MRRHVKEKLRLGVPLHEHGEKAPYSPVPARQQSRCATSFWIITVTLSKQPASRKAVMSGVVTLYGRLAHTFHGLSPSVSAQMAGRSALSGVGKNDRHIIKIRERFAEHIPQPLVQLNRP